MKINFKALLHAVLLLLVLVVPLSVVFVDRVHQVEASPWNPSTDIFFEYGGESGTLQPPWDEVRGNGWEGYGGIVEIDDTYARSGDYSIYIYQDPPPKDENDRRPTVQLYGVTHGLTEGYWSFWIYVDSRINDPNTGDWGPNIGGVQIRFGPEDEKKYRWWYGNQFHISKTSKRLSMSLGWGKLEDGIEFSDETEATEETWYLDDTIDYAMKDFEGEWVHLQQYFKLANGTDGVLRAWFSAPDSGIASTLFAEKTGFCSDPRGYSAWNNDPIYGGECAFHSKCSGPYPNLACRVYQGQNSFENWMWFDDAVLATEKVPENYACVSPTSLPRLEVSGNKVQFTNGTRYWLKGVAYGQRNWYHGADGCPQNIDQYEYMAEWNCTCVMLSVMLPPFQTLPSSKLAVLEQQVEWAAQNGMYSLIDCSESWGVGWYLGEWGELDWTAWKNAWSEVATRFQGSTNVLYGLVAEPGGISAQTYSQRATECIDVIRNIDSDVIIIVEGLSENSWYDVGLNFQYDYDPNRYGSGNKINRGNLLFDQHRYMFQGAGARSRDAVISWSEQIGAIPLCYNYPVISQQTNYDRRNSNGESWWRSLLDVFNDYGFAGWTAWVWGTFQSEDEQLNLCTDWLGSPSEQGLVLQDYLRARAAYNINTGLHYYTIQEAIDADETQDRHTILVGAGTYYDHVVVDKSVSLIGENPTSTILDGSLSGGVINVRANNTVIENFTIRNSGSDGISLNDVNNCTIRNNNLTSNEHGITLYRSSNNSISRNNITNNGAGIRLYYSSDHNTISTNNITNNNNGISVGLPLDPAGSSYNTISGNKITNNSYGIYLCDASNNTLSGNRISANNFTGILMTKENPPYHSDNNIICENNITNNHNGIHIFRSSSNIISGNNITANNECGIQLDNSSYNSIDHNNFVSNNKQASVARAPYNNTWDDGYPYGGNYWSDYTELDIYGGPNQDEPGSDGIWDHPYVIDDDNIDKYPFTQQDGWILPSALYLVVRGRNNRIYYRIYDSSRDSWDSWNVVPTGLTCDSPAATVCCGKLHIVVRGFSTTNIYAKYSLWYGWINLTDNSFSDWTRLSGATPSAPTLVCYDDRLVLVVRGLDNRVYYRFFDCVSDDWG